MASQGATTATARADGDDIALSAFHRYGLRFVFLLMAIFLLTSVAPSLLLPPKTMMTGVARAMLAALGIMAALGVVDPRRMLPVMLFELLWKLLWLLFIGLPLRLRGELDPGTAETFTNVIVGIPLVLLVFPYRYALRHYGRGLRERGKAAPPPAG
jgi:hypothetical protein